MTILVLFSSTYLARGIWDLEVNLEFSELKGIVSYLMTGIICDFIPVIILIIFHYKNFRVKNEEVKEEAFMEYHEDGDDEAYEVCHLDIVENESPKDSPAGLSIEVKKEHKTTAQYNKSTLINE